MSAPAITVTRTPDPERAVAAITLAFAEDPIARWAIPDPAAYARGMPAFVRAFGGGAFAAGSAYGADGERGAALWLPPACEPDEAALVAALESAADRAQAARVLSLMEQAARCHPDEPHWYLPLIGVDPAHRGRGYGAALLARALEDIDRHGAAAYLESSNPRNIPLYERHGFAVAGKIEACGSPPMFPMLRRARSAGVDRGLAAGVQRRPAALKPRQPHPGGVRRAVLNNAADGGRSLGSRGPKISGRSSCENLPLRAIAPSSQAVEPPTNPGWFMLTN